MKGSTHGEAVIDLSPSDLMFKSIITTNFLEEEGFSIALWIFARNK
jgi:hypothetical protein